MSIFEELNEVIYSLENNGFYKEADNLQEVFLKVGQIGLLSAPSFDFSDNEIKSENKKEIVNNPISKIDQQNLYKELISKYKKLYLDGVDKGNTSEAQNYFRYAIDKLKDMGYKGQIEAFRNQAFKIRLDKQDSLEKKDIDLVDMINQVLSNLGYYKSNDLSDLQRKTDEARKFVLKRLGYERYKKIANDLIDYHYNQVARKLNRENTSTQVQRMMPK
jgi:hypothetical protein